MDVMDKLNFEKELFYLDTLRKSKEAIYTSADEIARRKKLYQILKIMIPKLDIEIQCKINNLDSISESAYRYLSDYNLDPEDLEKQLDEWLCRI